jgi:hypothetical protein
MAKERLHALKAEHGLTGKPAMRHQRRVADLNEAAHGLE